MKITMVFKRYPQYDNVPMFYIRRDRETQQILGHADAVRLYGYLITAKAMANEGKAIPIVVGDAQEEET